MAWCTDVWRCRVLAWERLVSSGVCEFQREFQALWGLQLLCQKFKNHSLIAALFSSMVFQVLMSMCCLVWFLMYYMGVYIGCIIGHLKPLQCSNIIYDIFATYHIQILKDSECNQQNLLVPVRFIWHWILTICGGQCYALIFAKQEEIFSPGRQGRCTRVVECGPSVILHHILASRERHIYYGAAAQDSAGIIRAALSISELVKRFNMFLMF